MNTSRIRALTIVAIAIGASVALLAPRSGAQEASPSASPAGSPADTALLARGEEIFSTVCVACHQPGGAGVEGIYPALAGNPFVTLEDPGPVISTVLNGRGGMPRFGGTYDDEEIAAILTYVRASFGNSASPVSPEQVAAVRNQTAAAATQTPEGQQPQGQTGTPAP